MFKREIKYNLKSFLIWLAILIGIFLIVFLVYPFIASSDSIKQIDELVKIFPKELIEAFNMDISSMTTAFGWLKSEGFVMILLVIGCYASILGSNILLKEESDKTIEYLNSLPISREKIVLNKAVVGIIYIVLMVVILGIFNYIGLSLSGDFDKKQYLLLSITPLFSSLVIYSLSLFISTFFHKTKKITGISLGLVFLSYIFQTISSIDKSVEFLKYTSAFTLADIRNVILNIKIEPIMIWLSLSISVTLILFTLIRYKRKNLI